MRQTGTGQFLIYDIKDDKLTLGANGATAPNSMANWTVAGPALDNTFPGEYMPQLQHNMWVINAKAAALSITTGGGKMDGDHHPRRSPLPAPPAHSREKILALC
jgi:hypothetical protein